MQLSSDPTTKQNQLNAIKAHVETNYNVNGSGVYEQSTVNSMNQPNSPDFWVLAEEASLEKTGMGILLSDVANLTDADVNRLRAAFDIRPGGFDPANQDDRALFGDVFSSAGAQPTIDSLLADVFQRKATEAEKVLATGAGSQATDIGTDGALSGGDPGVLGDGASGPITLQNLIDAANNGV